MFFKKLGISESILKIIEESGFTKPTYIQEKSIPPILEGKDVIGQSSTGSGKTLAFGCGIIQNMDKSSDGIKSIVLTPTRELAEQVRDALRDFSKYDRLRVVPIYGGVSINPQISQLRKADVVVATPGRLLDHLNRRTIDLSKVQILVLDEADRMVDMGFIDDVNKIIRYCSKKRQTLLFSATMSSDIENIKHQFMNNPISIMTRTQVDPSKLKQVYYDVKNNMKFSLLVTLLSEEHSGSVLVFCNTRVQSDFVATNLRLNKFDAVAIHGGYTQAKRSATMDKFKSDRVNILVCTDVAARGLDIPGVSHVYNFDIPKDSKEYIHRIGRTARAGKEGMVINILSDRDHTNFSNLFRVHSNLNIENLETPHITKANFKILSRGRGSSRRRGHSGSGGGRSSGNSRGRGSSGRHSSGVGRSSGNSRGRGSSGRHSSNRKRSSGNYQKDSSNSNDSDKSSSSKGGFNKGKRFNNRSKSFGRGRYNKR